MYNNRKFVRPYQVELKRLSKELLVAKKKVQETFLRALLKNDGRCWTEISKYVKRLKGNRENILVIRDHIGKLITDPIENANSLNSYYALLFSCGSNNLQNQSTQSGNRSPLVLILYGSDYQQLGEKIRRTRSHS
jgi:hypothetical protein